MPIRHKNVFDDLPARLRLDVNPYVQELMAAQANASLPALYGPALQDCRGQWRQHFKDLAPSSPKPEPRLILEIGMHKGRCLTAMASAHPNDYFLGMDITFKRVVLSARKCKELGLGNALSILADARHLPSLFRRGELSGIIAFFPDPWTKKKSQGHNRLFNAEFCQLMAQCLRPAGFFWFKTDSLPYFEATSAYLKAAGFTQNDQGLDLQAEGYESNFESMFRSQGSAIYEGLWQGPASSKQA